MQHDTNSLLRDESIHQVFIHRPSYRLEPVASTPQPIAIETMASRRAPSWEEPMLDRAQLYKELNGAHHANFVRYAIYYTPLPGSPLSAFGRSWFGRANDGATLQAFSDAGLTGAAAIKPLTGASRYSGLYAVFKAPFCLREGMGQDALKAR